MSVLSLALQMPSEILILSLLVLLTAESPSEASEWAYGIPMGILWAYGKDPSSSLRRAANRATCPRILVLKLA